MADHSDLLQFYQSELSYLRQMGLDFARRYPKVAARLELGESECPDPHVERLIESFAFLTARLQHNLDSEFSEISSALLGVLHPQYLAPVPSTAIAQFDVDPDKGVQTSGHLVPAGTPLFCEAENGQICRFRSCYPVTLWPLEVQYAAFESPDDWAFLGPADSVHSVLRLSLRCNGVNFEDLELGPLRFYLSGEDRLQATLFQLLFSTHRIAVMAPGSKTPAYLPGSSVRPVGFEDDQAVLAHPSHIHPGHRLLQEYFACPRKFMFFDLVELARLARGERCDLLFLCTEKPDQRIKLDRSNFLLGCTPIINLFRKTAEPIRLDQSQSEYRLVPDLRREPSTEIHSILKVSAASNFQDDTIVYEPYYSYNHRLARQGQNTFWHLRRVASVRRGQLGTDVYLRFVDLEFTPTQPPEQTVFAHTLCTNRDLAERLLTGTLLQIEDQVPVHRISCVSKPTRQLQPPLQGATLWRLISHLSLNHLSLAEGVESLKALREILRLGNLTGTAAAEGQIRGLRGLSSRRVLRHVSNGPWSGFCRGLEISLLLDERNFVGHSAYLFASVLSRFLATYATVNSFTELVVSTRQREGVWKRWPPMAGRKTIL